VSEIQVTALHELRTLLEDQREATEDLKGRFKNVAASLGPFGAEWGALCEEYGSLWGAFIHLTMVLRHMGAQTPPNILNYLREELQSILNEL